MSGSVVCAWPGGLGAGYDAACARLAAELYARGHRVLSLSLAAHEALASVPHEHVVLRGAGAQRVQQALAEAAVVVAALGRVVAPGAAEAEAEAAAEERSITALLRAAALDGLRVVVLCSADHFALARKGAASVPVQVRRALAAHALRYLSARDGKLARLMTAPAAGDVTVLVVGNGGREHALAAALARSPQVRRVVVAPGNGGTAAAGGKVCNAAEGACGGATPAERNAALVALALAERAQLCVVGPEQPLSEGLADAMRGAGVPCLGPSQRAAQLEASKAVCKAFMARHGIPSARYAVFSDFAEAARHLEQVGYPVVIKASGLAQGKGVVLPASREEALAELRRLMVDRDLGEAGATVVIEERLSGEEVSLLALCDGRSCTLLPAAQDHKRVLDGDAGPNTGGMGAYAPAPALQPALRAELFVSVMQRAVDAAAHEGFPFLGVLFAGLMLTAEGPRVLEFNCRLGDPETQAILPLLESDLFEVLRDCVEGQLLAAPLEWAAGHECAAVVLAARGYPAKDHERGQPVALAPRAGVDVYHAGTVRGQDGALRTSGGRVLSVVARRPAAEGGLERALADIYAALEPTTGTCTGTGTGTGTGGAGAEPAPAAHFPGQHFRRDVGARALRGPVKIGVLGSTRGTDLQYIIDAVDKGWLRAELRVVVSNLSGAYILTRAREHGLPAVSVSAKGLSRPEFDQKVTTVLKEHGCELILLIGYMRIVSDEFCDEWKGRLLNVHPSLLPDFAGGMDLNVHEEVIKAGKKETGCTIHGVTKVVDGGPIIVQRRCPVHADDTPDALKARVQAMEGPAFLEAIQAFVDGKVPIK